MQQQGQSTVTIEHDDSALRIFSVAPSIWPMIGIGAGIVAILGFLGLQIYYMVARDLRRGRGVHEFTYGAIVVGIILVAAVVLVIVQKIRKQNAPRGVIIERGEVTAYTPDDTKPQHRFSLVEISAAEMRSHAASSMVDLVLHLRAGSKVTVIRQQPPEDVSPAVDAVNGMIQSDRHFGFEVVVVESQKPPIAAPATLTETPAGEIEIDFDRPA